MKSTNATGATDRRSLVGRGLGATSVVVAVHALVLGAAALLLEERFPVRVGGIFVPPELVCAGPPLVAFAVSAWVGRLAGTLGTAVRKVALVVLCVLLGGLSVIAIFSNAFGLAYEARERHAEQFDRIIAACAQADESALSNHCQATNAYPGGYTAEQCMRECRARRVPARQP